jgi:pimeloyl-ACP methyl ester carboxylesterase
MLDGVYCLDLNNSDVSRIPELDVVFVHGLSSSADAAWKNANGDLWPLWLKPMLPNARVILLNYPAPTFFSSPTSRVSIRERARNLADFLPTIGIGNRPTVFVCHSLGGIVVKEILRSCVETGCALNIAANTVGVIFLATPHAGSDIVRWLEWMGSNLTADLAINSEYILSLRDWFSQYTTQKDIAISAYYETQTYKNYVVVSKESADPCCKMCNVVALDYDHCNMAKPISPNSDVFIRLKRDIELSKQRLEKMTTQLVSVDDILALPELTNKMYFDIINFLNVQCALSSQHAVFISNPCGAPKPSCIIVSKDPDFIKIGLQLQERFPDRFSIQGGLLGEFTSDTDEKSSKALVLIHQYLDNLAEIELKLRPLLAWKVEDTILMVTVSHAIDFSIHEWCVNCLHGYFDETSTNAEAASRNEIAAYFRSSETSERLDFLAMLKNETYKRNKFRASLFNFSSMEDIVNLSCSVRATDFRFDIAIVAFDLRNTSNVELESWCLRDDSVYYISESLPVFGNPTVGALCTTPTNPLEKLEIESINETVFFPMHDKVTTLKQIMVLSGGQAKRGESGAPVLDSNKNIVGMIVGRTNDGGKYKYLAVNTANIAERISKTHARIERADPPSRKK